MALTKEERDRLTLKALQLQKKTRQRKSVLEPYKDWIRDMIETRDMTFRILTNVLQTECEIKITEQSLNEWYRRHIGKPPRSRSTGKRSTRQAEDSPNESKVLEAANELEPLLAATSGGRRPVKPAVPAKPTGKQRLTYNSPDQWSL